MDKELREMCERVSKKTGIWARPPAFPERKFKTVPDFTQPAWAWKLLEKLVELGYFLEYRKDSRSKFIRLTRGNIVNGTYRESGSYYENSKDMPFALLRAVEEMEAANASKS